jgi:hypothetical protein
MQVAVLQMVGDVQFSLCPSKALKIKIYKAVILPVTLSLSLTLSE